MKKILSILGLVMILLTGCSAESEIEEYIENETDRFNESDGDILIVSSDLYLYDIGDNLNFMANDSIRRFALSYANNYGEMLRLEGRGQMIYADNHDWYKDREAANKLEPTVHRAKHDLLKCAPDLESISTGGIWALHSIVYKEYTFRAYEGPYVKYFLYLFSDDGEDKIWSDQVTIDERAMDEVLRCTNTKVEEKKKIRIWGA